MPWPREPKSSTRHLIQALVEKLDHLNRKVDRIMATLDDVKQSVADLKTEVTSMQDTEQSAVTAFKRLADLIGSTAASATDLDGLKADMMGIKDQLHAEAAELGAAVATAPTGGGAAAA